MNANENQVKEEKNLNKLINNKIFVTIVTYFSIISPFVYYLTTDAHFFLGRELSTLFSAFYYSLMIICAIFAAVYSIALAYGKKLHKAFSGTFFGVFIFTCLSLLFNIGYAVGFGASWYGYLYYLKIIFPYLLAFVLSFSFLYLIPLFNNGKATVTIAVMIVCIIFLWIAFGQLELKVFKLKESATVFDTGDGYSVVWSANDKSIGWLEYDYLGEHYKIYHDQEGRKVSDSIIHYVKVPYEHLKNNDYTIYVQRVLSNRAYAPRTGKTLSQTISFKGDIGSDFDALILSDTHNITKAVRKKIDVGTPDLLFMLGDFIDELHREEDVSKYLLGLCYDTVKGQVPVIFSRGNHDLHSEMGIRLSTYIGFDETFYQAHYGNYDFTVLDSGAGSPDDEIQLGGLADYEKYRKKQMDWMNGLTNGGNNQILVTHVWYFSEDPDVFATLKQNVERLGLKGILAGHSHKCAFYKDGFQEKSEDYLKLPTVISGGVINLIYRQVQYTKAHFDVNGIDLTGYSTKSKEPLFNERINCD